MIPSQTPASSAGRGGCCWSDPTPAIRAAVRGLLLDAAWRRSRRPPGACTPSPWRRRCGPRWWRWTGAGHGRAGAGTPARQRLPEIQVVTSSRVEGEQAKRPPAGQGGAAVLAVAHRPASPDHP
jgi:hypothetical protein